MKFFLLLLIPFLSFGNQEYEKALKEFKDSVEVLKEKAVNEGDVAALQETCEAYGKGSFTKIESIDSFKIPLDLKEDVDLWEKSNWLFHSYIWCRMYLEVDSSPFSRAFDVEKKNIYTFVKSLEKILSSENPENLLNLNKDISEQAKKIKKNKKAISPSK